MWWNRRDGDLVRDLPAARRIMPYLLHGRNESAVYFEQRIDISDLEPALAGFRDRHGLHVTVFHVVLAALATTLHERPALNRFVAGGRLYQRRGVQLSWTAKQAFEDGSPLLVVKRTFVPGEPFLDMVRDVEGGNHGARKNGDPRTNRELAAILALPGVARRGALALVRTADTVGLLPGWFTAGDPMFASAFVANLGSVQLDAAYHHLYEYGSIGLFCVVGRTHDLAAPAPGGRWRARREVVLRLTFDERLEDGLYAQRSLQRFRELLEEPSQLGISQSG